MLTVCHQILTAYEVSPYLVWFRTVHELRHRVRLGLANIAWGILCIQLEFAVATYSDHSDLNNTVGANYTTIWVDRGVALRS